MEQLVNTQKVLLVLTLLLARLVSTSLLTMSTHKACSEFPSRGADKLKTFTFYGDDGGHYSGVLVCYLIVVLEKPSLLPVDKRKYCGLHALSC